MGYVRDATETSIAEAVRLGKLDPKLSAGPIAACLECAARVDGLDLDDYEAREIEVTEEMLTAAMKDNVSLPTYLKYCEALGLTPAKAAEKGSAKDGGSKVSRMRENRQQQTGARQSA